MLEKLQITERQVGKKNERYLGDTLRLTELLVNNKEYVEAHLQARRSLRGFKKLGESGFSGYERSLQLLIRLCKDDGKLDEEEGYAALLASHETRVKGSPSTSRKKLQDRPAAVTAAIDQPLDHDTHEPAKPLSIVSSRQDIEYPLTPMQDSLSTPGELPRAQQPPASSQPSTATQSRSSTPKATFTEAEIEPQRAHFPEQETSFINEKEEVSPSHDPDSAPSSSTQPGIEVPPHTSQATLETKESHLEQIEELPIPIPDISPTGHVIPDPSANLMNPVSFLPDVPSITLSPVSNYGLSLEQATSMAGRRDTNGSEDNALRRSISAPYSIRSERGTAALPPPEPEWIRGDDQSLQRFPVSPKEDSIARKSERPEDHGSHDASPDIASPSETPKAPFQPSGTHAYHQRSASDTVHQGSKEPLRGWDPLPVRPYDRPGWSLEKSSRRDEPRDNRGFLLLPNAPDAPTATNFPECRMCGADLRELSDETASRHVSYCKGSVRRKPVTSMGDPEAALGPTIVGVSTSLTSTKKSVPVGKWECCNCGSLRSSNFWDTKCGYCGHLRDSTCRSSGSAVWTDLGPIPTPIEKLTRRKVVLLGDTMCGKTWLAL